MPKTSTIETHCRILTFRWARFRAAMGISLCKRHCCATVELHTPAKTRISYDGLMCLRDWVRASLSSNDIIPATVTSIRLRHPNRGVDLSLAVNLTAYPPPKP